MAMATKVAVSSTAGSRPGRVARRPAPRRAPRGRRPAPAPTSTSWVGLAHGSPTHSVEPSPRLWCFQIGVCGLERVDEVAAGVEGLAAVRRGRRDDDGEVADLQGAGAVHGGHAARPATGRATSVAGARAWCRRRSGAPRSRAPSRTRRGRGRARRPTNRAMPPHVGWRTASSTSSTDSGSSRRATSATGSWSVGMGLLGDGPAEPSGPDRGWLYRDDILSPHARRPA